MSEVASGGGAVGQPAMTPKTAGDVNAAAMPPVPAGTQRMRLSEFKAAKRDGTLPAQAPREQLSQQSAQGQQPASRDQPPQSTRERIAEKSRELEAKQNPDQGAVTEPDVDPSASPEEHADAEQAPVEEQRPEGLLSDADIIAKYREWEQSDLAPEEIFADKLHPVKVRGQDRYVDYNELRQGYMRHGDYTARGNELKQKEQQVAQQQRSIQEHFETIKDPDQMLEIYERNGYSDQLEKVAEKIAQRRVEHRSLVIAAGRAAAERLGFTADEIRQGQADNHREVVAAMQRTDDRLKQTRQVEIENRKLAFERERFHAETQAQKHAQEVAQHQQTYQRQLDQLRPGAFRANGVKDTQQNRVAFLRHLGEVVQLEGLAQDGISRAQVMSAARNLKEESEDRLQGEQGLGLGNPAEQRARAQHAQRQSALGPNRVSTGAGKPLQAQQNTARRPSEFAAMRRNGQLGK